MRPVNRRKKKKPTPRQRKLLAVLAAGADRQTAAQIAGYACNTPLAASQSVYQALKHISSTFPDLMEKHGLTDDVLIATYLKPLLKASRTKHFAHNGKVKSMRKYKDNDTRLAALDMAFKLKGSFAPVKTENESRSVSVIVVDVPRPKKVEADEDDIAVPAGENSSN